MNAQQLKNSILQMAVQGKLVPQDPNDEPASVLLERIRKEKEKLIKEGKIKKEKNPSYIFRGEDNLPYEKIGKNEPVCIADEVPCDVPDTWEWVRLSNINDMYTGNSINETEKKLKYTGLNDGRCYIGTKDVSFSHKIDYDNGVRIPFDNDKFRVAPKNSILMCIEGGSAGRKIAFTNQEVCFGNKLCCFVSCCIDPMYLYYYLQSPIYQSAFKNNTSGIIGGVSVNVLKNMFFPVPPLSEQHRIVAKIEEVESFIVEYESREIQLSSISANFPDLLKKSILQQAVMGKLVPQDPNDEPAAILLEKIYREKNDLIRTGKFKKDKYESIIYRRDNSYYENVDGVEQCVDEEIPYELPESWCWMRLGSLIQIESGDGLTSSEMLPGNIPVYGGNGITGYHNKSIVHCETVVIGRVGYYCGSVHVTESEAWVTDNAFIVSYPQKHVWRPYLVYTLRQMNLGKNNNATAQPVVSGKKIYPMLFPLPPFEEQKRIAAKIEELLPLCEIMNR